MRNEEHDYSNFIDLQNENSSLTKIIGKITPGSSVLEFGPAGGYMTRYLKENLGCKIVCVEISEELANSAKLFCERMIIGDIDHLDFKKEFPVDHTFDFIIFSDVLEHLYFPKKPLSESLRLLKENGRILASIPNIAHGSIILQLLNGRFEYQSQGLLDNTHIRFFTKSSIYSLFQETGYKIDHLERVKIGIFETEFDFKKDRYSEIQQEAISLSEESETYQFIVDASRSSSKQLPVSEEKLLSSSESYREFLDWKALKNAKIVRIAISFQSVLNRILK